MAISTAVGSADAQVLDTLAGAVSSSVIFVQQQRTMLVPDHIEEPHAVTRTG